MGGSNPSDDVESILADRQAGFKVREIAHRHGRSRVEINRIVARAGMTNSQEYDPSQEEMSKWCKRHLADLQREHGARR